MRIAAAVVAPLVTAAAVTFLTLGSSAAQTSNAADVLYVSPSGVGAACVVHAPCSLTTARDKVRRLAQRSTGATTVELLGGT
jgi:hypothetical protein